mmetsp:Transcript_70938/g.148399  ORF Transcript_70938/g.148399 Transcript_70938/m.148399 type:complete len:324 (+) Transcript_70938:674-1645(+)
MGPRTKDNAGDGPENPSIAGSLLKISTRLCAVEDQGQHGVACSTEEEDSHGGRPGVGRADDRTRRGCPMIWKLEAPGQHDSTRTDDARSSKEGYVGIGPVGQARQGQRKGAADDDKLPIGAGWQQVIHRSAQDDYVSDSIGPQLHQARDVHHPHKILATRHDGSIGEAGLDHSGIAQFLENLSQEPRSEVAKVARNKDQSNRAIATLGEGIWHREEPKIQHEVAGQEGGLWHRQGRRLGGERYLWSIRWVEFGQHCRQLCWDGCWLGRLLWPCFDDIGGHNSEVRNPGHLLCMDCCHCCFSFLLVFTQCSVMWILKTRRSVLR